MIGKVKEYLAYGLHIATFILYFILLFSLENPPSLGFLQYFGFLFFGMGIIFVILSIIIQTRKRESQLVRGGVYALVRHPMYFGAMCLFLAMVLFLPHWIMILLVLLNLVIIFRFMLVEERQNLERFGEDYQKYMDEVPRLNLILGVMRAFERKQN